MTKEDVFKNIVFQIRDWYKTRRGIEKNDLSTLKILKLFFFIASNSEKLLSFFEFSCMPYGHIEKELYERIKKDVDFGFFKMSNYHTEFIDKEIDFLMSYEINYEIVKSIELIEKSEPNFIYASAFDLVDLNTQWDSYKLCYKKTKGVYVFPCSNEIITKSHKSFYIKDLHRSY